MERDKEMENTIVLKMGPSIRANGLVDLNKGKELLLSAIVRFTKGSSRKE